MSMPHLRPHKSQFTPSTGRPLQQAAVIPAKVPKGPAPTAPQKLELTSSGVAVQTSEDTGTLSSVASFFSLSSRGHATQR